MTAISRDISPANFSRRAFVASLGLGAGVLIIGLPQACAAAPFGPSSADSAGHFGAMLAIAPDDSIHFICPSSEMGQGTHEALARIICEELDCGFAHVSVRLPWADPAFINPVVGKQLTANSMTVVGYYAALRKAGAAARAMLLTAAASRLGVPADQLATSEGMVHHQPSNRSLSYGALAADAALLPVPANPVLKSPASFRLIGGNSPRKDLLAKITGSAEFGIDVHEKDMLHAALTLAPHPAASFEVDGLEAAKSSPGVVAVVKVNGGMAVIANRFWRAKAAAEKLTLRVTASPIAGLDNAAISARIEAAFANVPPLAFPDMDLSVTPFKMTRADPKLVASAIAAAPRRIEARYEVPYLAHATMEPLCCSAKFENGALMVRGPLQDPQATRDAAAQAASLPLDKVRVEVTFIGGGFGRKWSADFAIPAVQAAMAVPGRLVKVVWTREQDFAFDQFRPGFIVKSQAGLGPKGEILAMHSQIAGQSITHYHKRRGPPGMADPSVAALLIYGAYGFPNKLIEYHEADLAIPVGFWRSVTMSQNAFFAESMIDEVALATKQDPYMMRRSLLASTPRLQAVLDRAAQMIDWDKPRRKGIGRGIAISYGENQFCAQAVEVEVKPMGKGKPKQLTIRRIACAFDCGLVIDPAGVESQISGGIIFGLQAALWGEAAFAKGRVESANFNDYRMPLLADTPPIEVALIAGSDRPGSAGESGTPVIAPALVNAIANAGGPRIRRLPISRDLDI